MTRKTAAAPRSPGAASAAWARGRAFTRFAQLGALVLFGLGFAACVSIVALALFRRDDGSGDGAALLTRFDAAQARLDDRAAGLSHVKVDLSDLNEGDWRKICFYGGYLNPSGELAAEGARLSLADVVLWKAKRFLPRLAEVEEHEFAVAMIDENGRTRLLHLSRGLGYFGEYDRFCVSRPETFVRLANG